MIPLLIALAVIILAICALAPCLQDDELDAQDLASLAGGRHSPSGDSPAVVCAWCARTIRDGAQPPSHGMCPACYAKCRADIRATVPPGAPIPPDRWAPPPPTSHAHASQPEAHHAIRA